MSATMALRSKSLMTTRAMAFSARYKHATSEQADRQSFWNDFFDIFGMDRQQVAVFEKIAKRSSTGNYGWIDLLFPGHMAVEHKSAGHDLEAANQQLLDYLPSLTQAEHPWLLVACDFKRFRWTDLVARTEGEFLLEELHEHLDMFWWIAGYPTSHETFQDEEDVNLAATSILADLHDHLADSGYGGHPLREWMTRILFCLFADDAGVWERAAFHAWLTAHTRQDGSDLGPQVAYLFQLLATPNNLRPSNLDLELEQFIYINGDIFNEVLPIPSCSAAVREALLKACSFNWAAISPAIFGSMFQNVMTAPERRQLGAHYTTEKNILRTIGPLFLDELEHELAQARTKPAIERFLKKIRELRFFDPACGCGNFLVVTYRELRRLETAAIRALLAKGGQEGQLTIDVTLQCQVHVGQFYGIELEEFPAKIARTAMYLVDHLANRAVSVEFGQHFARFPIPSSPHIVPGDALELDWSSVLPPEECDYCFGNPPFAGHTTRSLKQSDQMRAVWGSGYAKWLDFVTTWYRVAQDYDRTGSVRFAFVSTNSIAQGEQVARLWSGLQAAGFGISFAHQTFAWTSEAKGRAHVHVVIVGFAREALLPAKRRLFSYPDLKGEPQEAAVDVIGPYLVAGSDVYVSRRPAPFMSSMPTVKYGSLFSDGGGLVVEPDELSEVDAGAKPYLRRYVGSRELVNGTERSCLWMPDGPSPTDLAASAFLRGRLSRVRDWRLTSRNQDTKDLAQQPYRPFHDAQPTVDYLAVPAQVSANRDWYTCQVLEPDVIASNTVYIVEDPDHFAFGILSSAMFMAWLKGVGGKIKSDPRFSGALAWNTFPLEAISDADRRKIVEAGRQVVAARPPDTTLAEMYNPLAVPPLLVAAHKKLDAAVDGAFGGGFKPSHDRLQFLLARYQGLVAQEQL